MMTENIQLYTTRKHRTFRLPAELDDVRDFNLPLYILVALWAIRMRQPVTVRMVRDVFCISLRRASDVLEYMTEQGASVIDAECVVRPIRQGDKRMRREWVVTCIHGKNYRRP
ncbi:CaiF/GrlA family transcriptional regulator [Citrobacter amalonaticus]|uniref:CaiF/GrlA family transcriptional regulator n=1 Tax=Citrobacter amalonaticus TaxID=35703 RepID=UPI001A2A4EDB|nr:CaiF/GrlA family transcriptional regulator [Citrobacter amalonaticus]HDQ2814055.1 CaiF/GrlA family transcriptional regulator [Citrobacter amalonaticus]